MKNIYKKAVFLVIAMLFFFRPIYSCTIISTIDEKGQVWNLNNEDGPYGVANFLNVFPKSKDSKYGYYTLSYFSPELGTGGSLQGGMNEVGLTFDFNAIDRVDNFDTKSRKEFPKGDDAILPYILANMSTVEEVMEFFSNYWFQNGFRSAQMHVADKQGKFAIISASGMRLQDQGQALVSTNFDICGNESSASCWRYPIAVSKLEKEEVNLLSMMSIALETRQKNGSTMYTNIQNLSTGDIWLFSQHDPNVIVNTNIKTLLDNGQSSYTFSDLKSLVENRPIYVRENPILVKINQGTKYKYVGTYNNSFTGDILVKAHEKGLEVSFADGNKVIFQPISENEYVILDADVKIEFRFDDTANVMVMSLYENGYWSFKAWFSK